MSVPDIALDPAAVLRDRFGHSRFRPGQRPLVEAALAGRDAIGILPTGGGKSICYQIPAFLLPGVTVVVSPLVSLMEDQLRRAREVGLSADALHSGLCVSERDAVVARLARGDLRLVFVAPERFESPGFQQVLPRVRASLMAVDEAHCVSMWGHDFRPAYGALGAARNALRAPALALTATATPAVRADIERLLGLKDPTRVVGSFDRPNLRWGVREVPGRSDRSRLIRDLVRHVPGARLVYAATRRRVETIRHALARRGVPAEAYHAGLSAQERSRVQEWFLTAPAPLVVATNAFGMGIDRSDVRLVVHDQLPGSLEAYYQEAGRAGRDGKPAVCLALHSPGDEALHRRLLSHAHPPAWRRIRSVDIRCLQNPWYNMSNVLSENRLRSRNLRRIRGVRAYAESRGCRRAAILAWFGETAESDRCGSCDRCGSAGVLKPWRQR